ncbi:adenine deaminase [Paenibacillus sp. J31TS4]|uniref:adenine deaminase n=1 Tax=Paenibacillus sp. J31TS4 TaxID=2807195 RepID=UPI001B17C70D|nr:adenine deaminase C-terminal domain-containing protein [Paenibacillus sp. J31TS4]GIP40210.1 adenine deaminase [Paenibacillus sp. J31TS4]
MKTDLGIRNVNIFNAYMKQFIPGNAVVADGRFYYIGQRDVEEFEPQEVVEGNGRYMIPGLIDIHLHIESTMVTPETFSYGLIKNGVTTVVSEPHEMANVFGLRGVQEMIRASRDCTADIYYAVPSSVPASGLETAGGEIDIPEIEALLQEEKVICLGEIMNYLEVIREPDSKTNRILAYIRQARPDFVLEGHFPRLLDLDLCKFVYAGVDSDHTQQTVQGMEERIRAGMFVELQEKSMTPEIMEYVSRRDVSEHYCLVTDDVMADSLAARGHLNHLVKKAMDMGLSPEKAIYAASFTPARRMGLRDRGSIAPGKTADFLLVSDLRQFRIDEVYKRGRKVYDRGCEVAQAEQPRRFPEEFYRSVKLDPLENRDFAVRAPIGQGECACRILTVADGTTFTKEERGTLEVEHGLLQWEESPYALLATFERYGRNGGRAYGLVGGDTIKRGAIATTYSHDNHNLLVIGHNADDMRMAANEVIRQQGGYCVVENGKVLANVSLPVGGILSEEPLERLAEDVRKLREAMLALGYRHYNPIMSLSTHSLPVSPALKLTDRGLIDVNRGTVVPLFLD